MAGVQFDRESAGRIANTVRTVERGLGIPTKRKRRALPALGGGEIVLVRLLESIAAADFAVSTDSFYDELRRLAGGRAVNTLTTEELEGFAVELEALSPEVSVASGLAYLCELEAGSIAPYLDAGEQYFKRLRYTQVVRVFNMHQVVFYTDVSGGDFGGDGVAGGSLGDGFCNAEVGPDGELWLVGGARSQPA